MIRSKLQFGIRLSDNIAKFFVTINSCKVKVLLYKKPQHACAVHFGDIGSQMYVLRMNALCCHCYPYVTYPIF